MWVLPFAEKGVENLLQKKTVFLNLGILALFGVGDICSWEQLVHMICVTVAVLYRMLESIP